jgi:hypothetical protein
MKVWTFVRGLLWRIVVGGRYIPPLPSVKGAPVSNIEDIKRIQAANEAQIDEKLIDALDIRLDIERIRRSFRDGG